MSWPGKFGQATGLRRDFQDDGDGESAGQAGPPRRPGVAADLSVVHAPFKSDGEPTDAEVNDADIYKGFLCRMRGLDSNLPPNLQLKALESGVWTLVEVLGSDRRQGVFLQSSQKHRIHSCPMGKKEKKRQDTFSAFTCRHVQNYSPPVKMPIISNIFDSGENSNPQKRGEWVQRKAHIAPFHLCWCHTRLLKGIISQLPITVTYRLITGHLKIPTARTIFLARG